jgi:hypothetical protein
MFILLILMMLMLGKGLLFCLRMSGVAIGFGSLVLLFPFLCSRQWVRWGFTCFASRLLLLAS